MTSTTAQKTAKVQVPRFQVVQPGHNYLQVHGKALQRMLLLGRLFEASEVGSYLLTSHEPNGKPAPPPIDIVYLYSGQDLTNGHIIKDNQYDDINKTHITQTRQRIIGRHHSHGTGHVFQSGTDQGVNENHLHSSSWNTTRTIPLSTYLANQKKPCPPELAELQLLEERRGLVVVTTNYDFQLYGEVLLRQLNPTLEPFNPKKVSCVEIQPFLYPDEEPPSIAATLDELIADIQAKKETFRFSGGPPKIITHPPTPQTILDQIELAQVTGQVLLRPGSYVPKEAAPPEISSGNHVQELEALLGEREAQIGQLREESASLQSQLTTEKTERARDHQTHTKMTAAQERSIGTLRERLDAALSDGERYLSESRELQSRLGTAQQHNTGLQTQLKQQTTAYIPEKIQLEQAILEQKAYAQTKEQEAKRALAEKRLAENQVGNLGQQLAKALEAQRKAEQQLTETQQSYKTKETGYAKQEEENRVLREELQRTRTKATDLEARLREKDKDLQPQQTTLQQAYGAEKTRLERALAEQKAYAQTKEQEASHAAQERDQQRLAYKKQIAQGTQENETLREENERLQQQAQPGYAGLQQRIQELTRQVQRLTGKSRAREYYHILTAGIMGAVIGLGAFIGGGLLSQYHPRRAETPAPSEAALIPTGPSPISLPTPATPEIAQPNPPPVEPAPLVETLPEQAPKIPGASSQPAPQQETTVSIYHTRSRAEEGPVHLKWNKDPKSKEYHAISGFGEHDAPQLVVEQNGNNLILQLNTSLSPKGLHYRVLLGDHQNLETVLAPPNQRVSIQTSDTLAQNLTGIECQYELVKPIKEGAHCAYHVLASGRQKLYVKTAENQIPLRRNYLAQTHKPDTLTATHHDIAPKTTHRTSFTPNPQCITSASASPLASMYPLEATLQETLQDQSIEIQSQDLHQWATQPHHSLTIYERYAMARGQASALNLQPQYEQFLEEVVHQYQHQAPYRIAQTSDEAILQTTNDAYATLIEARKAGHKLSGRFNRKIAEGSGDTEILYQGLQDGKKTSEIQRMFKDTTGMNISRNTIRRLANNRIPCLLTA